MHQKKKKKALTCSKCSSALSKSFLIDYQRNIDETRNACNKMVVFIMIKMFKSLQLSEAALNTNVTMTMPTY